MKTIKSLEDITTLEVGDVVVFGNLEYVVNNVFKHNSVQYYLYYPAGYNGTIFEKVNLKKRDFVEKLGIDANCNCDFPEVKSLEVLTALVSALFKEYEKQNQLPKTWEEFCKRVKIKEGESYIDCYEQDIIEVDIDNVGIDRDSRMDKNLCTSKQEAKAFLALMQLRQLRKAYVKDWEPKLGKESYYGIIFSQHGIHIGTFCDVNRHLSFPTHELAKQFLTNFKDLLEIAKPLL
jgi:hypothetical protein